MSTTTSVSRQLFPRLRESRFRGNAAFKLANASLPSAETFGIVAKGSTFTPDAVIASLTRLSQVTSPSLVALSTLAARTAASSEQYYPPQIVDVLSIFSKIGFSDPVLFEFISARKDDVLNECSPKRIVSLLDALSELQLPLFHASVWPDLRVQLVRVLPQLRRGIPTVLQALARQGCADTELIDALVAQAECVYKTGEIEKGVFFKSLECASRMPAYRSILTPLLQSHLTSLTDTDITVNQAVDLLVAASRCQLADVEVLHAKIKSGLTSEDVFKCARLMASMSRHGLGAGTTSELIINFVETNLRNEQFFKFLPHSVLSMALLTTDAENEFANTVLTALAQSPSLDRLSAEKLLCLLRAAHISQASQQVVDPILSHLNPIARQLSVRESRYLWEVAPGIVPVSALPPLVHLGRESAPLSVEVVGGYSLFKKDNALELLIPDYLVSRPSGGVRRDTQLRLSALQRHAGDIPVSLSSAFSTCA